MSLMNIVSFLTLLLLATLIGKTIIATIGAIF